MRKLKTRHLRSFPSRLVLIVAGALFLIAAFAPRANAQLIAYFNFEGPPTPPYPVNMMSDVPPGFISTTLITRMFRQDLSVRRLSPTTLPPTYRPVPGSL